MLSTDVSRVLVSKAEAANTGAAEDFGEEGQHGLQGVRWGIHILSQHETELVGHPVYSEEGRVRM